MQIDQSMTPRARLSWAFIFRLGIATVSCWSFLSVSYTTLGASADGFGSIRCGTDIAKALIGKQMSNETVVALEKRHQDIGLKDVGADEISDHLSSISWLICGSEYMVLEDDKSVVRDAIKVPDHSKKSPQFMSICTVNGKDAIVFAILDNEKETSEHTLPAKIAWRIDEKKGKFVSIPVEGLRCPRSGITTSDGGR